MGNPIRTTGRSVLRNPEPGKTAFIIPGTVSLALFVALLAIGPVSPVSAQVRGEGGITLMAGLPQGDFATQVNDLGFGVSFFGGLSSRRSPFVVGADVGILIYGYDRRREPFSYTIPDVQVDVVTSNNIVLGHVFVRVRPPAGPIRPYVDALFGMKYLFTTTEIKDTWRYGDETIAQSTNFEDVAPSYGVGAGVDVQLGRRRGRGAVMLHLGVRYLFGGHADYLQEGSIRSDRGRVTYDVYHSGTDLLLNEVGVVFRF